VVWSNNSDTFLDNLVLQSYWMVAPLLFPAPGIVFLIHKLYDQVSGMIGHSGHEYNASMSRFPSPLLAVIHHDLHHRYYKYNFATHFALWDRIMNTLHPGYDDFLKTGVKRRQEPPIESRGDIFLLSRLGMRPRPAESRCQSRDSRHPKAANFHRYHAFKGNNFPQ
jgi:sterol desaturase/sphingolipid hydroxylase (fatty acid hydroxylase superfamily)